MEKTKAIADRYKIKKTLFKVNNYLYARIFDKYTLDTVFGCVYLYENQEPGQILKMLLQKFSNSSKMPNLIFPSFHIKDNNMYDKSASIFFMEQQVVSLGLFTQEKYESIEINQMLKFSYDAFCSLHYLHSHDIIHGNISLDTCYLSKNQKDIDFALNILDTSAFHEQMIKTNENILFRSQSQQNGLKTSYKDDAECIIYILLHLISKGKMLSKQRFLKDWVNPKQLLRWKTMDFFKEMVGILPPQLEFLTETFTIVKSLSRNQKPDYPKFIKKAYSKLKEKQSADLHSTTKKMLSYNFSKKKLSQKKLKTVKGLSEGENENKKKLQEKPQKRISKQQQKEILGDDEQEMLLVIDSENDENELQSKYSKLETTKCTTKTKSFWNEKVTSDD